MEAQEAEQGFIHFKIPLDAKNLERDLSDPWITPTFPAAQLFRSPKRHGAAPLDNNGLDGNTRKAARHSGFTGVKSRL